MRMRKFLLFATGLLVLTLIACQGQTTDARLKSGQEHLEAGEYPEAIADLESVIEADPGNAEAHLSLGQAYNHTGDLEKARDEFSTAIALDPDSASAHHNLGVTYFQLGASDAALDEFKVALRLDPDDPDTHYQLGAVYLNRAFPEDDPMAPPDPQLVEQATAEFETALELKEGMPEALIGMANVYMLRADYASAIESLQQAIEQMPDSPEAYYALGGAFAQSGDVTGACEAYSHFLTLSPPPAWRDQVTQEMVALGCQ